MSSALDEDTQQTLAEGRETAGAMLRAAQKDLQKVFIVFLIGFLGTFYALRLYVWSFLKSVTKARLDSLTAGEVEIIAQTPFDVILLQAKIGLIVGIVVALPVFLYFSRDALVARGLWPDVPVARWKIGLIALMAAGLFAVGVAYGYLVFFPVMFAFLANNALSAGIQPSYSIVKWAQFIGLLTFSFGFAAQMPLAITALSYAEIVPYETFRDKWRHAVVLIFVFGAVFSPPDPFTQIMWAAPLLVLYAASLYLAKVVVTAKRGSERIDAVATARIHWNALAGAAVAAAAAVFLFFTRGGPAAVNGVLDGFTSVRVPALGTPGAAALAVLAAVAAAAVALAYFVYQELEAVTELSEPGEPAAIDLEPLDKAGVEAAPPEAFAALSEEEALAAAQAAIDEGDNGKAQAILDRWDEADQSAGGEAGAAETGEVGPADATQPPGPTRSGPTHDLFAADVGVVGAVRRGAGFVDWRSRLRALWNVLAGIAVLVFGVGYALVERPALADRLLTAYGTSAAELLAALPVSGAAALALFAAVGVGGAALLGALLAVYFAYVAGTDPTGVDVEALSAEQVRRAPTETFAALSERRANFLASSANEAGDSEKARAILDRFDDVQAAREAAASGEPESGPASASEAAGSVPGVSEDVGDRASRATGTFLEGLTDGESGEEEIGGYYDDLAFIADSLRSRMFHVVAVFGVVMVSVFAWLYAGGIGTVRESFVDRLPAEVVGPEAQNFAVIALHPVEALIFEVKISTIIGVVAAVPVAAYYAWPALRDRGFVRGRRQLVFGWLAALLVGLAGGLYLGAYYVAPTIISYLVGDALRAGMVISYRISDFFWLVFFTTVGVGLLADIPVLMLLLNSVGLSYESMRSRWREVTVAVMLFAALFTPADAITMFLVTIPLMVAYGVGILVLFVVTLGGRRNLAEPTVNLERTPKSES
ncbi:twin-arginine translocase subunit TatC [Halobaculum sp. D14]|uniref:twin-arginine translocase subunit TatC n=1 Tax=Halobaculum sp. D14 TaxID=3421642 RepID=UPI003EB9BAD6